MLKANLRTSGECLVNLLPDRISRFEKVDPITECMIFPSIFLQCSMGLFYLAYKTGLFTGCNLAAVFGLDCHGLLFERMDPINGLGTFTV